MKKLTELTIEIVQRCPNSCLHCSSLSHPNAQNSIDARQVLNVAKQSAKLGLEQICLSGGEPLLHPELPDIVAGIDNIGLSIGFYTTGIYFNNGNVNAKVDWSIFPKKSTRLIFSLHSCVPSTHDLISGRDGAFQLTKMALCAALEQGYCVETHIVPNKLNLYELEETFITLKEWGVKQISFLRLVPQGNAYSNADRLVFNKQEKHLLYTLGQKLQYISGSRFGIPFSAYISHQKKCNAGENKLIIRYDGAILPCEAFKDKKFNKMILGNINSNSLAETLLKGATCRLLLATKEKVLKMTCESCPAQFLYLNMS